MKFSIITATYNSEATVKDTIESVLKQTYRDIEYIIVDGGSKDKTLEIVKHYEPEFEGRMKWISEKDNGIYDAMNKGIRMATGDVVGILNSDDFYTSENVLEHINRAFLTNDVDAVYADIHFVDNDNLKKTVRYYSSKVFRRWLMRLGFMPAHPSFYIKRECLDRVGLYDTSYRIAADFEFLLRAIFINRIRTRYMKEDFVTMRTGGVSTSGLSSHKMIMKEHLRAFKENNIYTNRLLLSLRYVYKVGEVILSRIKK